MRDCGAHGVRLRATRCPKANAQPRVKLPAGAARSTSTMAGNAQRYYFRIDDLARARGSDPAMSFDGSSAPAFAAALMSALRDPALFQHWRSKQEDPDAVDPALGALDASAMVDATPVNAGSGSDVVVTTKLPHSILRHRMQLIAGSNWTLRDVQAV